MKKILLFTVLFSWIFVVYAQETTTVTIPIIQNGEQITDTLDDGTIVTINLSSDDAEQENDEMDTLHDDDIDAGWEGASDDRNILTAGLRFQNIPVPKGATIISAHLLLNSHEAKTADDKAELTIAAHKVANAPTFTMDQLITDRPLTNAQVEWVVDEPWGLWTDHTSVDFKDVVQEIIDMEDWAYGNSIAIIISGKDQGPSEVENAREFEAFENIADPGDGGDGTNHPERVPKLVLEYSFESQLLEVPIIANGDVITDTLDDGTIVEIQLSSDDAEQENDEMDTLYDDDIDTGWEGAADDKNILTAGLRFQNITIEKGMTIDSAFIIMCSHEAKTAVDEAKITIAAHNADNSETFTMDQLITDRPLTAAQVYWVVNEPWGLWTFHSTPDISSVIQEIINRDGWNSGNALSIILLGEDQGPSEVENAREFEAYENIADPGDGGDGTNHPERVPRLLIYYSAPQFIQSNKAAKQELLVYPNPVLDNLVTIEFKSEAAASVKILDGMGRIVVEQKSDFGKTFNLDISALPNGFYSILAEQEGTLYSQKLIVQ